jgi:hypothetical protein
MHDTVTTVWRHAGGYLQVLGLLADTAEPRDDFAIQWIEDPDDTTLPSELPSCVGPIASESTLTATGCGFLQVIRVYVLPSYARLVVLLENREDEREIKVWLAECTREANAIALEAADRWCRIGWAVSAQLADSPDGSHVATFRDENHGLRLVDPPLDRAA